MDNYFVLELVSDSDTNFTITLDSEISEHAYYEGELEITPEIEAQVLPTANKIIPNDITVLAIPYYETSNPDGTTVYIANSI